VRVLLLGARGMLGADIAATAPAGVTLEARDRQGLNIVDSGAVEATLDLVRPDVVINATGFTAVDRAETDSENAYAVNATAVTALGELCVERDLRVVHFSTDYVFDGELSRPYTEDDQTAPLNVYGKSKLAGEQGLLSSGAHALIVRTQWLFGDAGHCFPRVMWERATERQPTRVVNDQYGRPTWTRDVALATWSLVVRGERGLFHAANSGEATWYDVANRIFRRAGAADLLEPCKSREFPTPAKRPRKSVLDTSKLEKTLGERCPGWLTALEKFLERLSVILPQTSQLK